MFKILGTFCAILCFLFHSLFSRSNLENHIICLHKGYDLFQIIHEDRSFNNSFAFFLLENIYYLKKKVFAGEYEINKNDSVISFIIKLFEAKRFVRKITIPEGYTVKMIIEKLNDNSFLLGKIEHVPEEGSLMTDTYFFYYPETRQNLLSRMKQEMNKFLAQIKNLTNLNNNQIIILASIIEKESGNYNEHKLISSVFHNRLAIKMRLQTDPTVIYALSDKYGKINRTLQKGDLHFESDYNTYRHAGLPPGAICCPSRHAIEAAAAPSNTNFLYFVAESQINHLFAKNYQEHLKNIKIVKSAKNLNKKNTTKY